MIIRENIPRGLDIERKMMYLAGFLLVLMLTGCISRPEKTEKLRDLDFTVMDKEKVPNELKTAILENRDLPFKLTYADQGYLYIAKIGHSPKAGTA